MTLEKSAKTIMERCDILASFSEESGLLVRRFATPPMKQVNESVAEWMRAAGMAVHQDNIGNMIGRYEANHANTKTLMLGSHLDTVRDAGKYDGPLGVLTAIACVERLHARQERLPFAIEVYGFADEEGLRYHSAYLGSSVVAGNLDPDILARTDNAGIPLAKAIRTFGGDPDNLMASKRASDDLLGYCEVHIEQGPWLESLNLPVGVVSTITGHSRFSIDFIGQAGHAGTVPMHMRRDALFAAAMVIENIEKTVRPQQGLVATVGQVTVEPGASNVIPGKVTISLDVRHQDDDLRYEVSHQLEAQAHQICAARGIVTQWHLLHDTNKTPCTPHFVQLMEHSIKQLGYPVHVLPSYAGHDSVALAELTNVAMLFVRCKGGISHHPAESVMVENVAVAIQVMEQFFRLLAHEQGLA